MSSLLHSNSKNDREYLIAVKTEYKLLEKKYIKTIGKLKKWEARAILAENKGVLNLKTEAEDQTKIIRNDIRNLTDQLLGLKREVEKAVNSIQKSTRQLSVDPNKLLIEINRLIGKENPSNMEKEINIIKVDNELEELKRKMES